MTFLNVRFASVSLALSLATGLAMWSWPSMGQEGARQGPKHMMAAFTATPGLDVVLGRPTDVSITLSIRHASKDPLIDLSYWPTNFPHQVTNRALALSQGQTQEIILAKLKPDTGYVYQLKPRGQTTPLLTGQFHTQRPSGRTYTVTITADSHLDQHTDTQLYQHTLQQALSDGADFHIDLGDTFMTDKHESREAAAMQYGAQRYYFGQVAHSLPLYLVLGNHDGEEKKLQKGGAESLAVWANARRKELFPNPAPDGFYKGNGQADPHAGVLQDYYAWEWGDALFVVLNPYWHAPAGRSDERWGLSLGLAQYNWLKETLAASRARFKMVFVHQLVGGIDRQGRGGAEAASFGEWGGHNADGSEGFNAHRPGWDMPIHALLVKHRVCAVFHGHDHLYAKQEVDGIVYQEVPQPGHPGSGPPRSAQEYGYEQGTILGDSGHLRMKVAPDKITVDFVATEGKTANNVLHSYQIAPARNKYSAAATP